MKKLILLLLVTISIFGQKKDCIIKYDLKIIKEEGLFDNNPYLKNMVDLSINNINFIFFNLEINKSGTIFYFDTTSSYADDKINKFAYSLANYLGPVYNIHNDTILKQNSLLGNSIFIKQDKITNWVLTNETKMINNFLCYKATNTYTVVNSTKIFNRPVTAWYCPKLEYPYGPNGYGNLPGLILELQVRNSIYSAKIIEIDKNIDIDLSLKNIEIISNEELEKRLFEFRQKYF